MFHAFAAIGKQLADLHVHYETAAEYPLQRIENAEEKLNWRVEKMRLTKDKTTLTYNDFLTLVGIPEAAFAYRLGNWSALEWAIDQYQTHTEPRGRTRLHRETHRQSHHRESGNAEADRRPPAAGFDERRVNRISLKENRTYP